MLQYVLLKSFLVISTPPSQLRGTFDQSSIELWSIACTVQMEAKLVWKSSSLTTRSLFLNALHWRKNINYTNRYQFFLQRNTVRNNDLVANELDSQTSFGSIWTVQAPKKNAAKSFSNVFFMLILSNKISNILGPSAHIMGALCVAKRSTNQL